MPRSLFFFTFFIALFLASQALGIVDSKIVKTFKTEKAPLDIAGSPDGVWTYVLTEGGKLYIYTTDGKLNDVINVAPGSDQIFVTGPKGNLIYLSNSQNNTVQYLSLSFVSKIDTAAAPFLGNPGAPVTIALFSDFQ